MQRLRVPEIMDDPSLPFEEHEKALRGVERLNMFSGSASIIWWELRSLIKASSAPVSILDIATGSGDIPIALAKEAKKLGVELTIAGCDMSSRAIEIAKLKAKNAGVDIEYFVLNCMTEEVPRSFDVITTSLFTHHLDPPEVIRLIQAMQKHANKMFLINDLERSEFSYLGVWLATRLVTTSRVVQYDGPVSVRAAFTTDEFRKMAKSAGAKNISVESRFPCRLLLRGDIE